MAALIVRPFCNARENRRRRFLGADLLEEQGLNRFRSIALLFVCVLCAGPVSAQRNLQPPAGYPPQLTSELKQLEQAALTSDYAWTQLAHLTNNIGPRLAG